jgi:hypothetical protein
VPTELMAYFDELEARIEGFRQALLQVLAPYQAILRLIEARGLFASRTAYFSW